MTTEFDMFNLAIVAGEEWKEYVFTLAFSGIDGKDVAASLWVGGPEGGPFASRSTGVRLD